jgi:hypothetical protein
MSIIVLLLGSVLVGFMIAPRNNVYMVAALSPILALVAAIWARLSGYGLVAGIAITFACVTVSQMAYLLLLWLSISDAGVLTDKPADNYSSENDRNEIANKET